MQESIIFRNESFAGGPDSIQELKRNLGSMSTSLPMARQMSRSSMDLPWEIVISTPNETWAELDCYFYNEHVCSSMPDLQTLIRKAKGRTRKIRTWSTCRHTVECPDDGNWIVENAQFLNNLTALSLGYLGERLCTDTFKDDIMWGVIYRLESIQLSLPFAERLFERIDSINDSVALPNLRALDCYYDERTFQSPQNGAMQRELDFALDLDGFRGPPDYVMFPELRSFRIGGVNISHQHAALGQVTICEEQLRILLSGMPKLQKFVCSGIVVRQRPEFMTSSDCFLFYNHLLEEIDLSRSTWHHLPTLPLGLKTLNLMLTTCRPSLSPPAGIMKFPRLEYINFRGHVFTPGLKNSDLLNLFRVCNGPTITTLIFSDLPGVDFAARYGGQSLTRIITMHCPNLEHLDISYNATVDDDSLAELCELKNLRYLDLSGTFITYYGLSMLFCNGKVNLESLILEASLIDSTAVRDQFSVNVELENNLSRSLQEF
ncbi:hypothetical protein V1509DRAFT_619242 [Lipomyces kononenkoae]